jgi:hypothetical protein
MFSIEIKFDERPADGSLCKNCEDVIKGTMYVMVLQVGSPEDAKDVAKYCVLCKLKWDRSE